MLLMESQIEASKLCGRIQTLRRETFREPKGSLLDCYSFATTDMNMAPSLAVVLVGIAMFHLNLRGQLMHLAACQNSLVRQTPTFEVHNGATTLPCKKLAGASFSPRYWQSMHVLKEALAGIWPVCM